MIGAPYPEKTSSSSDAESGSLDTKAPPNCHTLSPPVQQRTEEVNPLDMASSRSASNKSEWEQRSAMIEAHLEEATVELACERHDRLCDVMRQVERHIADVRQDRTVIMDYLQTYKDSVSSLNRQIADKDNYTAQLMDELEALQAETDTERKAAQQYERKLENLICGIGDLEKKNSLREIKGGLKAIRKKCTQ